MAVNTRQKGNRGEKMVAEIMKTWTKKPFARAETNNFIHVRTAQNSKGDIVCLKEGHYFPFCIEVKNYKDLNFEHLLYLENPKIIDFWNQVTTDAKMCNKCPLLFMRYDRLPKGFFFIGIPSKIYYSIFSKHIKRPRIMALEYYDLVITTTKELLSVEYKEIRKIVRNHYKAQKQ